MRSISRHSLTLAVATLALAGCQPEPTLGAIYAELNEREIETVKELMK